MRRFRLSFRCPECGSREFGSQQIQGQLERCCHGMMSDHRGTRSCGFRWLEEDDWRHFVSSFLNREEYEQARKADMPSPLLAAVVVDPSHLRRRS